MVFLQDNRTAALAKQRRVRIRLTAPQKGLSVADSNSRVQAVIDGQGIALWDQLVTPEVNSGHLQYLSDIWLDEYGYYVHANEGGVENKALKLFLDWLIVESRVS